MDILTHMEHILHFDGILHWCFLIALVFFLIGLLWVVVRILIPLRSLTRQATELMGGNLPSFDTAISGIREIETLHQSLQYMVSQIKIAQEREITYRNALTESQENERKRIAREIHDDTIQ
ncbi:MAG: hypothetical protein JNJ61_14290, partial [Anaerolineae bacterium]|nr:hypothetical protein [Anaerolineae bacterium]